MSKHGTFSKISETEYNYDPDGGSDISSCIHECSVFAQENDVVVNLRKFNGVDVVVDPVIDEKTAYHNWLTKFNLNAEEYRNSPEGIRNAEEAKEGFNHAQAKVNLMLERIPLDLDLLVPWLVEFAEAADHIGVEYDREKFIRYLETSGYSDKAHTNKSKLAGFKAHTNNWTSREMGEYIVGQAISCVKSGMPPHPGLTKRFAEDYFVIRRSE